MNDTDDARRAETLTERVLRSRRGEEASPTFIAPWRRRQLEQAQRNASSPFLAVADLTTR